MKKTLRLVSLLLAIFMIGGVMAGCGPAPAEKTTDTQSAVNTQAAATTQATSNTADPNKKLKIGCTVYYMTEFVTLMKQGVVDEAEKQGVELVFLDANNDANKQLSQVENLLAQNLDAIMVANVDSDAIVPAIDMAKTANTPLVAFNIPINTTEDYYFAGPDDVKAGELQTQCVFDKIGGKGNIVYIRGPIGHSAQLNRFKGYENIKAKYPDIKVLADQTANWSRAEALTLMENWLQSFPGQINGVIAQNDEMALGAIQALEAKGLKDKIPVSAVDAIKDGCLSVKNGSLDGTVYQDAVLEGQLAVQMAVKLAKGETVEPKQQLIDMKLITKDNVDELLTTIYK